MFNSKTILCSFRRIFSTMIFTIAFNMAFGQQFSLYNSRTLYDSFENPSQKAFQVDSSRRFAFNFLIPTISINSSFSGPAESAFKSLIYDGVFNGRDIKLGENQRNTLTFHSNNYIAMFRILKAVKNYQEMGFSWQIRSDGRLSMTNETFAIFDDFKVFQNTDNTGLFNNNGYNQNYHQFSFTYRQNYSKRFSLGAKVSLLSGISYSSIKIRESELNVNVPEDIFDVSIKGTLKSSFKFDDFQKDMLKPNFKNPGMSVTASAGYKLRNGWSIMGNLKDLGFIRWSKDSYEYDFNTGKIFIIHGSNSTADDRLADSLDKKVYALPVNKSYISAINGKAEFLIHKEFGNYKPNLILSKSVYYKGGDLAFIHNYHYRNSVFTASTNYNTNGFLQLGGQYMIKSPNAEFYLGTDHFFKSFEMLKNATTDQRPYSSGYTAVSFYMGFGLKFGNILEHRQNATSTPGFKRRPSEGFIKKMFGKKE
ncbi:MAG: DUF5723 family protein [Pedobacter sp.]